MVISLNTVLAVLFIVGFSIPFYSYFVFPVILMAFVRIRPKTFISTDANSPSVALVISAFNESSVIEKKLKNSLALDYPAEKLKIFVLNDGSTDGTDAIVESFTSKGVIHRRIEGRLGKNAAINEVWADIDQEIVVFSDGNSMYQSDAIKNLVPFFIDPQIGCVCGDLRYRDAKSGSALGENTYWKYEQYLKKLQSRLGEVLVLNGAIFGIRRTLFQPLNPKVANDFQIPITIAAQGYSTIFTPESIAVENVSVSAKDEFERKSRIVARGFEGFFYELPRVRGFRLFQLISQKFLRWNIWLAMLTMLVTSGLLFEIPFFRIVFGAQLAFYGLAAAGPLLDKLKIHGLAVPYYFCLVNLSAAIGFWRFVSRKQKATWNPSESSR